MMLLPIIVHQKYSTILIWISKLKSKSQSSISHSQYFVLLDARSILQPASTNFQSSHHKHYDHNKRLSHLEPIHDDHDHDH